MKTNLLYYFFKKGNHYDFNRNCSKTRYSQHLLRLAYVIYAAELASENSGYLLAITKWLYPEVAAPYNTTCSRVERGIRTVVNSCWQDGNKEFLNEMAGHPLCKKPTSGEFIAILSEYLKQHHE